MLIKVILPPRIRSVNMSGVTFSLLLFAAFISMPKGSNGAYKMESYYGGNYKVMWKYDMIMDVFKFNITVNATGWVGFGVSKNKGGMVGYDVMVGGVRNMNENYGMDYYTTTQAMPSSDASQDYNLTSAMEMSGYTSLAFYRKRDTGDDAKDVVIMPGMMYLIWAYRSAEDVNKTNGSFLKHTQRGAEKYTFIDAGYTIVKINDNYRLHWKYDNSSDMFYFTVVVKATGWVAFGVSNQRGGMNGYDVMIGGVSNNAGYIGDYMTKTTSKPPRDTKQDFTLTSPNEERDGYTMLSFKRKRNTGDTEGDIEIKAGEMMNIVWAYRTTGDVVNDDFSQHNQRGGMPYTFNFMPPATAAPTKASSAMYVPSVFGIIVLLLFQCVIGA